MPRPTVIERVSVDVGEAGSVTIECHVRWLLLTPNEDAVIRKLIADLRSLGAVSADAPMPGVAADA